MSVKYKIRVCKFPNHPITASLNRQGAIVCSRFNFLILSNSNVSFHSIVDFDKTTDGIEKDIHTNRFNNKR